MSGACRYMLLGGSTSPHYITPGCTVHKKSNMKARSARAKLSVEKALACLTSFSSDLRSTSTTASAATFSTLRNTANNTINTHSSVGLYAVIKRYCFWNALRCVASKSKDRAKNCWNKTRIIRSQSYKSTVANTPHYTVYSYCTQTLCQSHSFPCSNMGRIIALHTRLQRWTTNGKALKNTWSYGSRTALAHWLSLALLPCNCLHLRKFHPTLC